VSRWVLRVLGRFWEKLVACECQFCCCIFGEVEEGHMTTPLLHCLVPQIPPQQQIYKGVYARRLTFTLTQLFYTQLLTRFLYAQLVSPCRSANLLSSSKRSMRIPLSVLRGSKKRTNIVEEILLRQIGREKHFCFNQLIVIEHTTATK
jgi:hypothetical protein